MAYVPTTALELWLWLATMSAAFSLVFCLLGAAIWKAMDKGKSWLIEVPNVPGQWHQVYRAKVRRDTFEVKKGDEGLKWNLQGLTAGPSNRGPVYLVDAAGYGLVAPTKDEPGIEASTGEDVRNNPLKYKRLRIWDTLTYWRAARENAMEDLYSSKKEKKHWMEAIAPLALIAVGVLSILLLFVLWKVLPAITGAASGA